MTSHFKTLPLFCMTYIAQDIDVVLKQSMIDKMTFTCIDSIAYYTSKHPKLTPTQVWEGGRLFEVNALSLLN